MVFHDDEKWIGWVDQLSDDNYVVIDEFIPEDLFEKLSGFLQARISDDALDHAGVGSVFNNHHETSVRGDFTCRIDKSRDQSLGVFLSLSTK